MNNTPGMHEHGFIERLGLGLNHRLTILTHVNKGEADRPTGDISSSPEPAFQSMCPIILRGDT